MQFENLVKLSEELSPAARDKVLATLRLVFKNGAGAVLGDGTSGIAVLGKQRLEQLITVVRLAFKAAGG